MPGNQKLHHLHERWMMEDQHTSGKEAVGTRSVLYLLLVVPLVVPTVGPVNQTQ
jgi:hypothetical protein